MNLNKLCKRNGKYTPTQEDKDRFYESDSWKKMRYRTLRIFGFKCMACKDTESRIEVDHIRPISTHWMYRFDPDNLQVLCSRCNSGKSNLYYDDLRPKTVLVKKGEARLSEQDIADIEADIVMKGYR